MAVNAGHPSRDLDTNKVRGLLLGLALGDAVANYRGRIPDEGELRVGVSTQLAAFTTEGLIRAMVRGHHKGIVDPAGVVWHAYNRWAALQGIERDVLQRHWSSYTDGTWPDGWLAQVPALTKRRGSAPATVNAITGLARGTLENPVSNSAGVHALTRTLPVAAMARVWPRERLTRQVEEMAALTHGYSEAQWASTTGVLWAAGCLSGDDISQALLQTHQVEMGTYIDHARFLGQDEPRSPDVFAEFARATPAVYALASAVFVTHSFPDPADALEALCFAGAAPHGRSVAVVVGAVLGAAHGVDVWPTGLVSRLEVAWPLDTLARDLVAQLTNNPGGTERTLAEDSNWLSRYPGW